MESVNYTYEYEEERLAWWIVDTKGKKIADAVNEESAELIVAALNGGCAMICEYYDIDGQKVAGGEFILLTKSLYRATVDAEIITGLPLKMIANSFAVMGRGNKRLVVSVQNG